MHIGWSAWCVATFVRLETVTPCLYVQHNTSCLLLQANNTI